MTKLKKLELLVKENLSILGANLYVDNGEVEQIRVDCESDLLIKLLQKLSIDHYSIRDGSVFKDIEIQKNPAVFLRVAEVGKLYLDSLNSSDSKDKKWFAVFLDLKFIGNYFSTSELSDVHHLEHYFGLLKCLSCNPELVFENL